MSNPKGPEGDKSMPDGILHPGSWRKPFEPKEEVSLGETSQGGGTDQISAETTEESHPDERRLYAGGLRGRINIRDFQRRIKGKKDNVDEEVEYPIEASGVKEIYRIGEKMPLFRLTPQESNPSGRVRTYSAGFTLAALEIPNLAFSVTLGSPKGVPISMFAPEPNQLTVEADLRKVAVEVRDAAACGTFPIEYFYTLDPKLTSVLQRLVLRIYDDEDGKIYEALANQRDLEDGGSLTFNDSFHEVKLGDDGTVVSRSPRDHSMAYTLRANTGAENTEAELLLLSEEDRLKVLRRPRLPRFSNAL